MVKRHKEKDDAKKRFVLRLAFRTLDPRKDSPKYLTYASIARTVCMTPGRVQYICQAARARSSKKPR